ncbi:Glycosyltransferase involved in cell wall bisynthesis [Roseomonas rosea]|uniref:Glycosyltransferase involved in cell wall bisynthesis n=1 Tax=Muricoccus roseus TaxID=198092 RepID=A0A1M6RUK7_9PROT|nr:glycosyltransferase family 4 protein [Roseomonas rosea]SHK36080.1 Glycosyltransferase involved in cell wall bisynthesis [Roseomonas rosea]
MRIGLISSAVPLVDGGYRFIVDWLREQLVARGHRVEVLYLPFLDAPEEVLPQMAAFRMIRLDEYFDRVITFRPPAHAVTHRCKVVWFIHHLRVFYDLWDTEHRPVADDASGRALRAAIMAADTRALGEAHRVFTNSRVVGDRLRRFNGLESEVLYPPVLRPERFRAGAHGDEIVSVCRMEPHKRQHLMVEAMGHVRSPVRLRLCGASLNPDYVERLRETARRLGVAGRVTIEERWITEEEKAGLLEHALASAYLPFDEDSYGYPTLEAAHAGRATVTTEDAGGVAEFVTDGVTGLMVPPDPVAIAQAFDRLHGDRALAARLGRAAGEHVRALGIDWDVVVEKLLA